MTTPTFAEDSSADPTTFVVMHQDGFPDATATRYAFDLVWFKKGWLEGPSDAEQSPVATPASSTSQTPTPPTTSPTPPAPTPTPPAS